MPNALKKQEKNNMARDPESLKALGKHTEYSQDYAPEVLETFENQHQAPSRSPASSFTSGLRSITSTS